jgi:hypothetical protein
MKDYSSCLGALNNLSSNWSSTRPFFFTWLLKPISIVLLPQPLLHWIIYPQIGLQQDPFLFHMAFKTNIEIGWISIVLLPQPLPHYMIRHPFTKILDLVRIGRDIYGLIFLRQTSPWLGYCSTKTRHSNPTEDQKENIDWLSNITSRNLN